VAQWSAHAPERVLAALEVRIHPHIGQYVVPHEATIRRVLHACNGDLLRRGPRCLALPRLPAGQPIVDDRHAARRGTVGAGRAGAAHRRALTTAAYAEVDRDALRELALAGRCGMTGLDAIDLDGRLEEYLRIRRSLGFKLECDGKLLTQFIGYLHEHMLPGESGDMILPLVRDDVELADLVLVKPPTPDLDTAI